MTLGIIGSYVLPVVGPVIGGMIGAAVTYYWLRSKPVEHRVIENAEKVCREQLEQLKALKNLPLDDIRKSTLFQNLLNNSEILTAVKGRQVSTSSLSAKSPKDLAQNRGNLSSAHRRNRADRVSTRRSCSRTDRVALPLSMAGNKPSLSRVRSSKESSSDSE